MRIRDEIISPPTRSSIWINQMVSSAISGKLFLVVNTSETRTYGSGYCRPLRLPWSPVQTINPSFGVHWTHYLLVGLNLFPLFTPGENCLSTIRLTLSHPRVINFKFPCSLTRNITSPSMENLAFRSLFRWKMIILPVLTTSLIHFCLKGWENALFELSSEEAFDLLSSQRSSPLVNF